MNTVPKKTSKNHTRPTIKLDIVCASGNNSKGKITFFTKLGFPTIAEQLLLILSENILYIDIPQNIIIEKDPRLSPASTFQRDLKTTLKINVYTESIIRGIKNVHKKPNNDPL